MSKHNFWNSLRVERNIRYRDLADLYGGSISKWGGYFSGRFVPSDDDIAELCSLFDVNFDTGKAEFEKAHSCWVGEGHSNIRTLTGTAISYKTSARYVVAGEKAEPESTSLDLSKVLPILYGKISCEDFMEFRNSSESDVQSVMSAIYGKVDCADFMKILDILNEEN